MLPGLRLPELVEVAPDSIFMGMQSGYGGGDIQIRARLERPWPQTKKPAPLSGNGHDWRIV